MNINGDIMAEMIDVYDELRNKTGKIIKREDAHILKENEYRIAVHCWIINNENKVLLAQRSFIEDNGGKWADTHGGIRAGETSVQGMIRELKEELGIDVNENELKLVKVLKRKNIFRDVYILKKDISIDKISFTDGEVMAVKYVSLLEFKEIIASGESIFNNFNDTILGDKDIEEFLK